MGCFCLFICICRDISQADQSFQRIEVCGECLSTGFGCGVRCIRLSTDELLSDLHIVHFFQGGKVARHVSVGHLQLCFERWEVHRLVHDQYRHDAQANATLKSLVEIRYESFHR